MEPRLCDSIGSKLCPRAEGNAIKPPNSGTLCRERGGKIKRSSQRKFGISPTVSCVCVSRDFFLEKNSQGVGNQIEGVFPLMSVCVCVCVCVHGKSTKHTADDVENQLYKDPAIWRPVDNGRCIFIHMLCREPLILVIVCPLFIRICTICGG